MRIAKFLRANGLNLVTQKDAPKYEEGPVEVYEPEELGKFFAACNSIQKITFRTFHLCGLRMQELMYFTGRDIENGFLHVQRKVAYPEFAPKAHNERKIPISPDLLKDLEALKETRSIRKGADSSLKSWRFDLLNSG